MNLNARILHVQAKLAALSHLFLEMGDPTHGFNGEETAGLSYLLEDIRADLDPILEAPERVSSWEPPTEQE